MRRHFFRRRRHFLHAHPQSHRADLGRANWCSVFPGFLAAASVFEPVAHHGRRGLSVDERGEIRHKRETKRRNNGRRRRREKVEVLKARFLDGLTNLKLSFFYFVPFRSRMPLFISLAAALVHVVVVLRGHAECCDVGGQSHFEQESVEWQTSGRKLDAIQHVCGANHPRLLHDLASVPCDRRTSSCEGEHKMCFS